jgi:hypothetical protein
MLLCSRLALRFFLSFIYTGNLNMIKELASKRFPSPSRTHLHADTKFPKGALTKRDAFFETSKNVIASLDELKLTVEEEDSEIEISGPFPLSIKSGANMTVARTCLKGKRAVVQQANAKPYVFFAHSDETSLIQLRTSGYTLSSVLYLTVGQMRRATSHSRRHLHRPWNSGWRQPPL